MLQFWDLLVFKNKIMQREVTAVSPKEILKNEQLFNQENDVNISQWNSIKDPLTKTPQKSFD